jgi:AMP nucleosidase
MATLPAFIAPAKFRDANAVLAQVKLIYDSSIAHLKTAVQSYQEGAVFHERIRAYYPMVRIQNDTILTSESSAKRRLSFGFMAGIGLYETTLTRPDLFHNYYLEQFHLLLLNHNIEIEVSTSRSPIPVHFSFDENEHVEWMMDSDRRIRMSDFFDLPDLSCMDDGIADCSYKANDGSAYPLALFIAPRVDYSLHRLRHYTGTSPHYFQNFVLFTNYQFYVDEFIKIAHAYMKDPTSDYCAFVEPGNLVIRRRGIKKQAQDEYGEAPTRGPQMPAYHLMCEDGSGITLINIGVGPSNAKTITDHVAVLRPYTWLILGHCAGLCNSQQLGDYVLAHGYTREDHVLDEELPLWVPIPALAEVQLALEQAVREVTESNEEEVKKVMRTGTVVTTDNRNWELLPSNTPQKRFSMSRAIALDMESATVAANGFRFRVPYGTLLCVSDKPLHGEIKLPGMANNFYRERVDQHLRIGILALELLKEKGLDKLHSRKLRSFAEVAFQ